VLLSSVILRCIHSYYPVHIYLCGVLQGAL
jgi:hypothetical protein